MGSGGEDPPSKNSNADHFTASNKYHSTFATSSPAVSQYDSMRKLTVVHSSDVKPVVPALETLQTITWGCIDMLVPREDKEIRMFTSVTVMK